MDDVTVPFLPLFTILIICVMFQHDTLEKTKAMIDSTQHVTLQGDSTMTDIKGQVHMTILKTEEILVFDIGDNMMLIFIYKSDVIFEYVITSKQEVIRYMESEENGE